MAEGGAGARGQRETRPGAVAEKEEAYTTELLQIIAPRLDRPRETRPTRRIPRIGLSNRPRPRPRHLSFLLRRSFNFPEFPLSTDGQTDMRGAGHEGRTDGQTDGLRCGGFSQLSVGYTTLEERVRCSCTRGGR